MGLQGPRKPADPNVAPINLSIKSLVSCFLEQNHNSRKFHSKHKALEFSFLESNSDNDEDEENSSHFTQLISFKSKSTSPPKATLVSSEQ